MQVTVPDVFVTPPEEELEYNPPFCYFDASEAARRSLSTGPDIHALDVALGLCQQTDNRAPTFTRLLQAKIGGRPPEAVVMPRRASALKLQDMNMDVDEEARKRDGQHAITTSVINWLDTLRCSPAPSASASSGASPGELQVPTILVNGVSLQTSD